jgi:hypothetical protein
MVGKTDWHTYQNIILILNAGIYPASKTQWEDPEVG